VVPSRTHGRCAAAPFTPDHTPLLRTSQRSSDLENTITNAQKVPLSSLCTHSVPQEEFTASHVGGEEVRVRPLARRKPRSFENGQGFVGRSAQELRGERQEELVGEASGEEGVVEARTALDEEQLDAALGLQGPYGLTQVHGAQRGRRRSQEVGVAP
jgi:hypothetical protein